MKRILLLIIFILLLTGCNYRMVGITSKSGKSEYTVEVYKKLKISEVVEEEVTEDDYLDTSDIKDYTITYTNKSDKTRTVIIKVRDTTPPTVMLPNNYNHIKGTNFTIKSDIMCADNYDKTPKCEVIGTYDLNTLGTYPVTYRAEDSSGNVFERKFNINVVEKPKDDNSLMSFEEVKKIVNENEGKLLIDVSKHEGNINWKKVKDSGVDYAFIRLGTQRYSTNELLIDQYFEKNYKEATKYGIKLGVYFFTYAKDKEEILKHADFVLEKIKGKKFELGVALDWECWELFNSFSISKHDLNEMGEAFLNKIKESGYKPILYSSKNYLENVWDIDVDVWVAHYNKKTNYTKNKLIWQFAPNGVIPGISSDVDVNVYYGD